jgi:hypothetical protein
MGDIGHEHPEIETVPLVEPVHEPAAPEREPEKVPAS